VRPRVSGELKRMRKGLREQKAQACSLVAPIPWLQGAADLSRGNEEKWFRRKTSLGDYFAPA
jgi:hypothetical protein